MKILLINDHIIKIGGAESFVFNLSAVLEKAGHQTWIIGDDKTESFSSLISRWYSLKWYRETQALLKTIKPDIVHINNCARAVSPSPIVAANRAGIPVVMTMHDFHYYCPKTWGIFSDGNPCPYGFGYRCFISNCQTFFDGYRHFGYQMIKGIKVFLHREILKRSSLTYVSPSKALAKNISKSLGVPVKVFPNGIDARHPLTTYTKDILFVGRIGKEKGLQSIGDALNRRMDLKTAVVGTGYLENALKSAYANIKFYGFQDPQEWYKSHSILVVPSLWQENFPTVILEAMSYGLCVIASRRGGIPELVKDKINGLLFNPGDATDFNRKLDYLKQNPSEIRRMGKNARKFVQRFKWNNTVKNYIKLYQSLIG